MLIHKTVSSRLCFKFEKLEKTGCKMFQVDSICNSMRLMGSVIIVESVIKTRMKWFVCMY